MLHHNVQSLCQLERGWEETIDSWFRFLKHHSSYLKLHLATIITDLFLNSWLKQRSRKPRCECQFSLVSYGPITGSFDHSDEEQKKPGHGGDNSGLLLSPDPLLQSERRFLGIDLSGPTVCWWAGLFLPGNYSDRSSSHWRFTFGSNWSIYWPLPN